MTIVCQAEVNVIKYLVQLNKHTSAQKKEKARANNNTRRNISAEAVVLAVAGCVPDRRARQVFGDGHG